MARTNDSMINPRIETLLSRESLDGSKFALVTLASYRARQINSYFNQLGSGTGRTIPPQVTSTARKPLSIAFEEIAVDKIVKIERVEEPETEDAELGSIGPDGDAEGEASE